MTDLTLKNYAGQELIAAQPQLAKACFELAKRAYPNGSPWSERLFLQDQKMPQSLYVIASLNRQMVGFLGCLQVLDQVDITSLAVHPNFQRQGIGRRLFGQLIATLATHTAIFLEVRKSNRPAIGLYQGVGFEQIGLRTNYYQAPIEDAILMKLIT